MSAHTPTPWSADTDINAWHIEPTELDDGSEVFDVIGANDEARVVIHCYDEHQAEQLVALLNRQSGASAEAL